MVKDFGDFLISLGVSALLGFVFGALPSWGVALVANCFTGTQVFGIILASYSMAVGAWMFILNFDIQSHLGRDEKQGMPNEVSK